MDLNVFGSTHLIYLAITLPLSFLGLYFAKRYAKSEKSQKIVLKSLGALLFVWILINRLSQVFRYGLVRWEQLIPDSFCGMTSLALALAVLLGKRDNCVYHFCWFLGLVGAGITVFNPTFLSQSDSIFYLPTISGLLHHSVCLVVVGAIFIFDQIYVTPKKWYCTLFGFTVYLTVGAFEMAVLGLDDAFHIVEPILPGTPLTAWVMAPLYAVGYALVLLIFELVRKHNGKKAAK
jgi:hypothetical protein